MEPLSPLISWVNPFPSRFMNRTIFFCNALESHECASCLLFDVRQYYCHLFIFIGSFLYQRAKHPQRTLLFINLLGKGLTPNCCKGDRGSIWWAPVLTGILNSRLFSRGWRRAIHWWEQERPFRNPAWFSLRRSATTSLRRNRTRVQKYSVDYWHRLWYRLSLVLWP